ncbi:CheR family methyltransferase [Thermodesulfobacteriota bacterium]
MKDEACICFLQWALPHLKMRWSGFKKVRGQVCKRLGRRLDELKLVDLKNYRRYLQNNPLEWQILDSLCRITISRFYRDQGIFDTLRSKILPELIKKALQQGDETLSCWCIGAASGEEPYSISLIWDLSGINTKGIDLKILATDVDQHMIKRARYGCYPESCIRELPAAMKTRAFTHDNELFCINEIFKKRVKFLEQDIRNEQLTSTFDLIFCRNLVFTYFSCERQKEILRKILMCLKEGGAFVIGSHEELPEIVPNLIPWYPEKSIYRREG